jgi:hypothetical protein
MPSGTPMAIEAAAAATTSTSVCTVCFQRFWLMMKIRPMKTPSARLRERCRYQASNAISAASSTGGTRSRPSTAPSSSQFRPEDRPRKKALKWSVRKVKNALPQSPIGIL